MLLITAFNVLPASRELHKLHTFDCIFFTDKFLPFLGPPTFNLIYVNQFVNKNIWWSLLMLLTNKWINWYIINWVGNISNASTLSFLSNWHLPLSKYLSKTTTEKKFFVVLNVIMNANYLLSSFLHPFYITTLASSEEILMSAPSQS